MTDRSFQLERNQPYAGSGPRIPNAFQIVSVARTGLQLDPAFGYASLDVIENADHSRIYAVTVRETFSGGSSTDVKLLVAPLLGSSWRIWTPSPK